MRKTIFLVMALTMSIAGRADDGGGKQLHDAHCLQCHDDSVYTRDGRFVASKEDLAKQVKRCAVNTGTGLSQQDVVDIVNYLNETYYGFD